MTKFFDDVHRTLLLDLLAHLTCAFTDNAVVVRTRFRENSRNLTSTSCEFPCAPEPTES
jgi:hypothetical protein